jgi:teichoic acid transport system ATP-binding protein
MVPKQYYREFWALKDISFVLKKGQTIGILGRNGSGKSTLLQLICGTLNFTCGSVYANGRVAALLELGSGFNFDFTGRENIYLNAFILGLNKQEIDEKIDEIIKFADIGEFIDRPVKTYSSGMVVRLAFSVAINVNPEILIVDEALAVGDFSFQQKCFKKIKSLKESGKTILLVTHDLSSIIEFCDWVFVIESGKILFDGIANDAVNFYKMIYATTDNSSKVSKSYDAIDSEGSEFFSKSVYQIPCDVKSYGTKAVEIYDWAILDSAGNAVKTFRSDEVCEIVIRIHFIQKCNNPIVGYFFTDVQGREIVGTNSEYLSMPLGCIQKGEKIELRFRQILGLSVGSYMLNVGCSEYLFDELVAHHRLYDLYQFDIFRSSRNVGFFLPETQMSIKVIS